MDEYIRREIDHLIDTNGLPSWHRNYYHDEGYQAFYYKMVHIASNDLSGYYRWKSYSMSNLLTYSSYIKTMKMILGIILLKI